VVFDLVIGLGADLGLAQLELGVCELGVFTGDVFEVVGTICLFAQPGSGDRVTSLSRVFEPQQSEADTGQAGPQPPAHLPLDQVVAQERKNDEHNRPQHGADGHSPNAVDVKRPYRRRLRTASTTPCHGQEAIRRLEGRYSELLPSHSSPTHVNDQIPANCRCERCLTWTRSLKSAGWRSWGATWGGGCDPVEIRRRYSPAADAWNDVGIAIPAFPTIVLMPFTYSIAVGIGAGFMTYVLIKLVRGKSREVHPLLWAVTVLFVVYFAIDPIEQLIS
jgi:hypothetical protein